MEPVTHVLTGMCLSRAGFHRRAAYATLAMAIAAEFPDIDTLWSLNGPVSAFQHHRGITHTFVGIPFEAALVVLMMYGLHRFKERGAKESGSAEREGSSAPIQWRRLYVFVILALLSHILLDYTNNYGVRPFFPFNPKWYEASIVFIFDPTLFLLLLCGLVLPVLFSFIGQEIAGSRTRVRGAGFPRVALLLIVAYWAFRAYEHQQAIAIATSQTLRAPSLEASFLPDSSPEADLRPLLLARQALASPDPLNPFHWYAAVDYGPVYQLATVETQQGTFTAGRILNKPSSTTALQVAQQTHLGKTYLDWSPMPWLSTASSSENSSPVDNTVLFQDVRFMEASSFLQRKGLPPLTGEVVLDERHRVIAEGMDGRFGR